MSAWRTKRMSTMALAALAALEREAARRFEVAECHIVHRLGEVPIAEASVAVVVTAAHRAPAFDACRWAMDELKAQRADLEEGALRRRKRGLGLRRPVGTLREGSVMEHRALGRQGLEVSAMGPGAWA